MGYAVAMVCKNCSHFQCDSDSSCGVVMWLIMDRLPFASWFVTIMRRMMGGDDVFNWTFAVLRQFSFLRGDCGGRGKDEKGSTWRVESVQLDRIISKQEDHEIATRGPNRTIQTLDSR